MKLGFLLASALVLVLGFAAASLDPFLWLLIFVPVIYGGRRLLDGLATETRRKKRLARLRQKFLAEGTEPKLLEADAGSSATDPSDPATGSDA